MLSDAKTSLERYIAINRNTFDNHPDVIFVKDVQFVYKFVNKTFLDINSSVDNKFVDKTDFDIHNIEKANKYRKSDETVVSTGNKTEYETTVEFRKQVKHYTVVKSPIYDSKDKIIGILGISRDITSHVELREEAISNMNLLDAIIDNVPYPIFVKDQVGHYLKVNQAFADRYELNQDEIIGFNDYDIFSTEFAEKLTLKDNIVLKSNQRSIQFFDTEEQDEFPYIIIKDVFCNPHGKVIGIVGVVNTLSDLQQVRQKLIQSQKMESISTLIGGIAHDMNNILTNVVGLSSILLNNEQSSEKRTDLKTILNASQQASNLISKLLAVDRKGRKRIEIIDVEERINDVLSLLKSSLPSNITLEKKLHKDLMIKGDPNQLSQIFMNLLLNAVEAIENDGKITIKTELETISNANGEYHIKAKNFGRGEYVKISIMDTGQGIEPNISERIFDPFFSTKPKNKQGSRGLGLAIVYGIVTNHEGAIIVESTEHKGTSFIIFLPHVEKNSIKNEEKHYKKHKKQSRILIVDDDKAVLNVIEKMLDMSNFDTFTTDNGFEALTILDENINKIDLAIIDLKMPHMDGLELTNQIKSKYSNFPIIISTGYSHDETIEKLLELGVNKILHKPYTNELLISTVDNIIQ